MTKKELIATLEARIKALKTERNRHCKEIKHLNAEIKRLTTEPEQYPFKCKVAKTIFCLAIGICIGLLIGFGVNGR